MENRIRIKAIAFIHVLLPSAKSNNEKVFFITVLELISTFIYISTVTMNWQKKSLAQLNTKKILRTIYVIARDTLAYL